MSAWEQDFIDEEEEGYIEFGDKDSGEFHFGYVHGQMDCRLTTRDGEPAVEWSWDDNDEMDPAQGRGRASSRATKCRHDLLSPRRRLGVRGEEEGTEWKEDEMMNEKTVQPGPYRHYKGNEYTVVGTARHSETLEELVVYRQEYGEHGLWVRPKEMFSETVKIEGQDVPRFQPLGSSSEQIGDNIKNIFDDLPQQLPKELVQILVRAADVRIERIISHGHASPADFWYDQLQHEWVIVLKGAARLQFEDGVVEMEVGDFINIPAFTKHRVDWTTPDEPTVWLGVRYGNQGQVI